MKSFIKKFVVYFLIAIDVRGSFVFEEHRKQLCSICWGCVDIQSRPDLKFQ